MYKRKILIFMILVLICTCIVGCQKEEKQIPAMDYNNEQDKDENDGESIEEEPNDVDENENLEEDNNEIEIIETEGKVKSKLDGLYYDEEVIKNRPVAVMCDNHPHARWQAGISQAEIVYECEVEYPYTRYLAIFQTKDPEQVGGVRSARPYYIYYALEYDPIYVHCGGSPEAFNKLAELNVGDIDGLYSGSFWRFYDTGKEAPNNLYTCLKNIIKEANNKGFRKQGVFEGYNFNDKSVNLSEKYDNIKSANYVNIEYNNENNTEYSYDKEKGSYIRSKDGELHIDENDNKQIIAKNIIVVKVEKEVLDNEGRLYLSTIGSGDGYYITNGESIDIKWSKEGAKNKTYFYDEAGNEIFLNPGQTWIQIISGNSKIVMEES